MATFTMIVVGAGLCLNVLWGILARARREYCGGRIAAAGIILPLAAILGMH